MRPSKPRHVHPSPPRLATYALAVVATFAGCVERSVDSSSPNPDSQNARQLQTSDQALKGRIAFASNRDGDFEIFVMRATGSHVRQLTHNRVDDTDPAWSPDGTRIAFVRRVSGNTDVFTMSSRGGDETRVTPPDQLDQYYDPTWTPNGRWITYAGGWDGATIYNTHADGTRTHRIVLEEDNSQMENPAWAPGGRRLVYTYDGSFLYRAVCCGGEGRQGSVYGDKGLVGKDDIDGPSWSPNGRWIMFSSDRGPAGPNENHDLFVVRPGGRSLRRIDGHPSDSTGPDWDPGSRRVVFASDRRGNQDIFVMNRGSKLWLLTRSRAADIQPDWWRWSTST